MVYDGVGKILDFRHGVSKKGSDYDLLELVGHDYRRHTIFVPPEVVPAVAAVPIGAWVHVTFTQEDKTGGSTTSLIKIQRQKEE